MQEEVMRKLILPIICVAALGACSTNAEVETGPPVATQPAPVDNDMLPSGVLLTARMDQTVSTDHSHVGDGVSATVTNPIIAQNGETVVPAGARIRGTVTGLDDSDHPLDRALIRINFDQLEFSGHRYSLSTDLESAQVRVGDRTVDIRRGALAGGAIGAVTSAILSGAELDEILKGAALGAGAGAVIGVITGGDREAELPAGSTLTLRTTQNINLR
jgi:hypothetical protein